MMEDECYSVLKWDDADEKLKRILGLSVRNALKKMDQTTLPIETLYPIPDWENKSDSELFNIVQKNAKIEGFVYVITDISYIKDIGVFYVHIKDIYRFMKKYSFTYNECFFNGDVLFISELNSSLSLFQHDGNLILYRLPLSF